MSPANQCVLIVNGGSSSIKFALYEVGEPLEPRLHGMLDRVGLSGAKLTFHDFATSKHESNSLEVPDGESAANFLVDWLGGQQCLESVRALGHRVVHGMQHCEPELVTPELLAELARIVPYDPDHLPIEIELIEAFGKRYPKVPQVACFDTAFHHELPRVAQLLPIPRRYEAQGVRRYGFHGLSYAFLMEELARLSGPDVARGRVILAHLGNGASLAAVRDGKPVDTSMSFTPNSGVPMSTRSGDLDPGVFWYLARAEDMSAEQFNTMVNFQSGLLGVSETSPDMRDLLSCEAQDVRAAEAVALFCYQVKKCIGSFAAALGGLDTLVFAGGIGENAHVIRARVCAGMEFLGVNVDEGQNTANAGIISSAASTVTVRVIHTNEELMMARLICRVLGLTDEKMPSREEASSC